jgi:rhodanese-related sulfurtransferase
MSLAKTSALAVGALGLLAAAGAALHFSSDLPDWLFTTAQTPNCAPDSPVKALPFSTRTEEEFDARDKTVAMVFEPNCYRVGTEYPVQIRHLITDGVWIYHSTDLVARVTRIQTVDLSRPPGKSVLERLGFYDQRTFEEYVRWYPEGSHLWVIDADYERGTRGKEDLTARIESPILKNIDWSSLKKEMLLVDVRSASEFTESHADGALNVPYSKRDPKDFSISFDFEKFGKEDSFVSTPLPQDRNTALVFVGSSPYDVRPFRALVMAYMEGWKNLYWLRSGEKGRIGAKTNL